MTKPLFAMTLWQPWATLVIRGARPFDFRARKPDSHVIGRRVVVHVGAKAPRLTELESLIHDLLAGDERGARTCLLPEKAVPILQQMIFEMRRGSYVNGVGIGSVEIGVPERGASVANYFGYNQVGDPSYEHWAVPMVNPEEWDRPIEAKGQTGFWPWNNPEGIPR